MGTEGVLFRGFYCCHLEGMHSQYEGWIKLRSICYFEDSTTVILEGMYSQHEGWIKLRSIRCFFHFYFYFCISAKRISLITMIQNAISTIRRESPRRLNNTLLLLQLVNSQPISPHLTVFFKAKTTRKRKSS